MRHLAAPVDEFFESFGKSSLAPIESGRIDHLFHLLARPIILLCEVR